MANRDHGSFEWAETFVLNGPKWPLLNILPVQTSSDRFALIFADLVLKNETEFFFFFFFFFNVIFGMSFLFSPWICVASSATVGYLRQPDIERDEIVFNLV